VSHQGKQSVNAAPLEMAATAKRQRARRRTAASMRAAAGEFLARPSCDLPLKIPIAAGAPAGALCRAGDYVDTGNG